MKKMNFTSISMRFALLIPMFLLLSSTNTWAYKGETPRTESHKKGPLVISALTATPTNAANCAANGSLTVTANITGIVGGYSVLVEVFNAANVIVNGAGIPGSPAAIAPVLAVPPGAYTVRVSIISLFNVTLETMTTNAVVGATDITAPIATACPTGVQLGTTENPLVVCTLPGVNFALTSTIAANGLTATTNIIAAFGEDCGRITAINFRTAANVPLITLPMGLNQVVVTATNAAGLISAPCTVVVSVINANASCGNEKAVVEINDANTCTGFLTSALITQGSQIANFVVTNVTVRKPGVPAIAGTLPFAFTRDQIGLEFEVMYMGPCGTMCFIYVRVLDKNAPVSATPTITDIFCTDLNNGKAPAPGAIIRGGTARVAEPINNTASALGVTMTTNPSFVTIAGVDIATLGFTPTSSTATPARVTWNVNDCSRFNASYFDSNPVLVADCPTGAVPTVDAAGNALPAGVGVAFLNQYIIRTWVFKDFYGNQSFAFQFIRVIKRPITIPTNIDILCTAVSGIANVGRPFIDYNGNGVGDDGEFVTPGQDYCGQSVTLVSQSQMPLCGAGYMVMRQWKTIRLCDGRVVPGPGTLNGSFTLDQVINVQDFFMPVMSFGFLNYPRIPEPQCTRMVTSTGIVMESNEFVYRTVRDRANALAITDGYGGYQQMISSNNAAAPDPVNDATQPFHYTLRINPLMDITQNCNSVTLGNFLNPVTLDVNDANCGSYPVTITSSQIFNGTGNIRFNGMPSMVLNAAGQVNISGNIVATAMANTGLSSDPFVIISATDACGKVTRIKVIIVIIDNVSPTAYCSGKVVDLTNTGQAFINGGVLSAGSLDNCTQAFLDQIAIPQGNFGRRLVRFDNQTCWSENLILECANVGTKRIWVRLIDMMGNYTDCWTDVVIEDKAGPSCPMSPDVTALCTDTRLSNIASFFTQPLAFDNCEQPTVKDTTSAFLLTCGEGTIIKSWTFTDKAGNSTTCTQRLLVSKVSGYRVTRLRSEDYTCTPNLEDDKARILSSIKNLNAANVVTCSAPVIRITEEMYMSTDFCRRIKRTYQLIDLCLFPTTDPTCDPIFLPKDFDTANLEVQDINGVVCFSRFITIFDKTPPVGGPVTDKEICVVDNSCAADFPTTVLTATDACGILNVAPTYLFFRWELRSGSTSGGIVASGSGNGVGATNAFTINALSDGTKLQKLPLGTYFLVFLIVDDCGNVGTGTPVKILIKDCKSPYINTHDKNTVLAYSNTVGTGMSQVCAPELINNIVDNCVSRAYLNSKVKFERASRAITGDNLKDYNNAPNTQCIMFSCADAGTVVAVRVWAIDSFDNAIFNIAYITVEDNNRACTGAVPQSFVTGSLKTENNQSAAKVTLTATTSGTIANSVTTDAAGAFSFNVAAGNNYVVKATKETTEDKYAGVTTFDIARISKHLLDIEKFNSAYQVLAADVDKSGDVDGADMLHIRNFILRKTTTLPGGVWRFIDKSYAFKNAANPFGEDFPEVVSLMGAKTTESANFVSVKLGDVNNTYSANLVSAVVRNSNALTLNVEDKNLVAGNEYTVNVTADNFNASAFQGTFNLANATIKSVKAGDLANYSDNNFGMFGSAITTSWNGSAKTAANVFAITFTANKAGKLSEILTVGSNLTTAVANDVQGNEMNINLKFSTGKVAGGEFALYQNTPNPVATETSIGFNMPKEGAAKLTIYSVEGKVVLTKNIDAKAGLNNVNINKSELSANGVLYYRLETSDFSATKKMIIIE